MKSITTMSNPNRNNMPKKRTVVRFEDDLRHHLRDEEFKALYETEKTRLEVALMIIKLRKTKKITQKMLAEKLGTSQSSVARLESGKENFTIDTLGKIATTLHKNIRISFV